MYMVDGQVRIGSPHQLIKSFASVVDRCVHELIKHRTQFSQRRHGGARAWKFFAIQSQRAVVIKYRDQAFIEVAVIDGVLCTPLAFYSQRVYILTAEAFKGRNHVCTDALVRLWVQVT
jgi:hypothetical protein